MTIHAALTPLFICFNSIKNILPFYENPQQNQLARGVFLKGAGVMVLWPQMLILAFYGVLIFG